MNLIRTNKLQQQYPMAFDNLTLNSAYEEDVLLEFPSDVLEDDSVILFVQRNLQRRKRNHPLRIRLSQKLFGPPRISLSWKERCHLFHQLGKMDNLISLTLHGTTMGQVLSAELIALAVPPQLQVLRVEAGLIMDNTASVCHLAHVLHRHEHLQELYLLNFLNHVRPYPEGTEFCLLDPLLRACASTSMLQVLEISCLASFLEWGTSLVSSEALTSLLTRKRNFLRRLNLTNLGLEDPQFSTIAEQRGPLLTEIVLNANENTLRGLRAMLYSCLSIGSKVSHLQLMNHVKLSDDLLVYIMTYVERYYCPLRQLCLTYPLRMDPKPIQVHLRLHGMDLGRRFFSPATATITSSLQVLAEVSDDPNCIYKLLQEQPSLLDRNQRIICNSTKSTTQATVPSWQLVPTRRLLEYTASTNNGSAQSRYLALMGMLAACIGILFHIPTGATPSMLPVTPCLLLTPPPEDVSLSTSTKSSASSNISKVLPLTLSSEQTTETSLWPETEHLSLSHH